MSKDTAGSTSVFLLGAIADVVAWDILVVVASRATAPPRMSDRLAASVGGIIARNDPGGAWACSRSR